jgi:hypothetical protein
VAVTESARNDLYTYLRHTMGEERATTLMEMVSPTGWADVATKQDVVLLRTEMAGLRTEMNAEFTQVRTEMAGLASKADLERALRTQLMATFAFYGIFMSIAVTLARLI